MLQARRYLVSGRVQGVGFRVFTEEVARREGLTGHVRNLPDGRVEAVATGDAEGLRRFERSLRNGPPLARVDDLQIEVCPPDLSCTGFRARG